MQKRIEWIDMAKTLTMLLVILGHCSYLTIETKFGGVNYGKCISEVDNGLSVMVLTVITDLIYSFHMPLFMALSGACFSLTYKHYSSIKLLLKNKAHRLLLPFIFTTMFLSIPLKYISGYWSDSVNWIRDALLGQVLLMGNSHLWFVFALFWMFLWHEFLMRLKVSFRNPLFLVGLIFCSWGGDYMSSHGYEILGLVASIKFYFYFVLGFVFIKDIDQCRISVKPLLLNVISFIFIFIIWSRFLIDVVPTDFSLNKIISYLIKPLFAMWGILLMIYSSKYLSEKKYFLETKWYLNFKKNSYELYLFSDPFNYVILALVFSLVKNNTIANNISPFILYILRFFCTIFFAYIVIEIKSIVVKNVAISKS